MIEVKNISYAAGAKKLLDDVSVTFEAGKLNLVIGPNGAGKSTLIRIICRQLNPSQGTIAFAGKNIHDFSLPDLAAMRAVLSQNIDLAFPMTIREVVMMGRYPHFSGKPTDRDYAACNEAMHFFEVEEMANRNYMTLSGGEKQRVHFARVVSQVWYPVKNGLRYLILDEPLTFLDIHYQFDFMHKIIELLHQKDVVVVGVVHDLNLAARFADKILLLNHGKTLSAGGRNEVLTPENIREAYQMTPVIHFEKGIMNLFFN